MPRHRVERVRHHDPTSGALIYFYYLVHILYAVNIGFALLM